MCGIVYKRSFNGSPVNQAVKQMYKSQRGRGYEGFGFFLPLENRLAHNTSEHRILDLLKNEAYESSEILFHHRFPTSTENRQNACHPFSTRANKHAFDHNYVLVHNGIVSNASTLKADHEKTYGIEYISVEHGKFNDSEALLYDVALFLDGKQTELKAQGSIAFIVKRDDGKTYFARNTGSPLVYELTSRGITVRSEGSGTSTLVNQLYEFDAETKELSHSELTIPSYSYGYDSYNYDYGYFGGTYSGYSKGYTDSSYDWEEYVPKDQAYRSGYESAIDTALAYGTTVAAIDALQERYNSNAIVQEAIEAVYLDCPSDANAIAVDAMRWEQDKLEQDILMLWDLWEDEEEEKINSLRTTQLEALYAE
jgi:predicted glutamine amidotransferase